MSGVANYMFVDAHTAAAAAAAAQAHAQYMHHGIVQGLAQQGIDLQTFQAAAAAQQDLQDHLHQQHQLGQEQHVPEHMQAQLEHMGMLPQANQVRSHSVTFRLLPTVTTMPPQSFALSSNGSCLHCLLNVRSAGSGKV